ncbi:caspase family protein [Amycolatopsis sp. NEAU-NG30]|uniref:Caspase family protein n=1 Tax=Amycolatopsis melonis TaxID=3156488 RepID=A0ABV0L8U3_9PSEU
MAGRRRALIVANGEYDNAGLQRLGSPAADADALAAVLSDRAISDFEVRVVRNETAHAVQAEIEDLCAEGRPDDVLLLHFSCHGLKDDAGGLYFAARNTRPDRLRSTAVPAQFVQQCIRQSRSRSIVLLLDCCYGGAFGQGVAVRAAGEANVLDSFRGGHGRAVITASNSIEYAFEGATLASDGPARPSVFTAALVEGLRTGEADRDEDGWIALGELYEYLFDRVRERNPKQTPSRDIEMQGELYLAKSRRRRIKPSPIPPDLASAIAAENPFTRLGAVAELRRRLASDNLPVAMGAFEALQAMASTDVQHVAAAAADAAAFAAVRVDPAEVRFTGEEARRIRVLGAPVARECSFEASHEWIEVREVPDGAEVRVTRGPELRRGKVVVKGPTGETVVTVEAEPAAPEASGGEEVAEAATAERDPAGSGSGGPVPTAAAPGPAEPSLPHQAGAATAEPGSPGPVAAGVAAAERDPAGSGSGGPVPTPAAPGPPEPSLPHQAGAATAEPGSPGPVAAGVAAAERDPAGSGSGGPVPTAAAPGPAEPSLPHQPGTAPADSASPGLLLLTGGLLALTAMAFEFHYAENSYSYTLAGARPGLEWYVWLLGAFSIAGGCLAVPAVRARVGTGWAVGLGSAALWGLLTVYDLEKTFTQDDSSHHLGAGFGFLFTGLLAVLAAGAVTAWHHGPRFRRPGRYEWAAIALGVLGAVALFVQYSADSFRYDGAWRAFVFLVILSIAVPVVAALVFPAGTGGEMLAGWAIGALGVVVAIARTKPDSSDVNVTALLLYGLTLLLAVVVGVLMRRNQPNGRQP